MTWYDGSPEADARWDAQEDRDRSEGPWIGCEYCTWHGPERELDDHVEKVHGDDIALVLAKEGPA